MSLNSPKAAKKDKVFLEHGVKRTDPFYWLNERENPEVKDLLEAENKYLEDSLAHTRDFQATLYEEMKGRIKEQ